MTRGMAITGKLFGAIGHPARPDSAQGPQPAAVPAGYARRMVQSYENSRIRRASARLARLVVDPPCLHAARAV